MIPRDLMLACLGNCWELEAQTIQINGGAIKEEIRAVRLIGSMKLGRLISYMLGFKVFKGTITEEAIYNDIVASYPELPESIYHDLGLSWCY